MIRDIASTRTGATGGVHAPPPPTQASNSHGIAQLPGSGAQTGHVATVMLNPLLGGAASPQTHYTDRNGQVQPRSIQPLGFDAGDVRQAVGGAKTWGKLKNALPFVGRTTYGDVLKLADRFSNSAPGLSPEQRLGQLTALKQKIDQWQVGHGDASGPHPGAKEQAVASLAGAVTQAIDEARFDAARTGLLGKLPHGATIGADGAIGGTVQITGIPHDAKGLDEFQGMSLGDFASSLATKGITPKPDARTGQPKPLGTINHIPVAGQASNDLYRLDLTIHAPGGNYVSRQDPETSSGERNNTAVQQLRAFAGSDQATTVLSGIVNQQILRPLSDGMTHADGSQAQFALGHHGAPGQVKQPDGSFQAISMFNMGSAAFDLSMTAGGDFKVSVEWPMYITDTGRGSATQPLPGMQPGDVIKAQGRMELIIDAQEAAQGRVHVTAAPATVQLTGGINL